MLIWPGLGAQGRAQIALGLALLAVLISGSDALQSVSSSSATSTSTTIVRLRANKLARRPESCRESLPRKSEELPALVITGRVKEVYPAFPSPQRAGRGQQPVSGLFGPVPQDPLQQALNGPIPSRALVNVGRVIKGNKQLVGGDIIVSGFNDSAAACPNYVKPNDTYILLLNHEAEQRYTIQGSNLLSMNLANLDRVNAIAADEPFKRRGPIEDILCEAKYCPFGRCVVVEAAGLSGSTKQAVCKCPQSCSQTMAPVCGSDNATYSNECQLISAGCGRQRPLFVTREGPC